MDARGHGESDWSPTGDYRLSKFAADVAAVAGLNAQFDPARDPVADLATAKVEAQRGGKRIVLDVGGEWCSWCHYISCIPMPPTGDSKGDWWDCNPCAMASGCDATLAPTGLCDVGRNQWNVTIFCPNSQFCSSNSRKLNKKTYH